MAKLRVGILGATGMVGQRFIQLLEHHPWFEVAVVAASPQSAGKAYREAVQDRWQMGTSIPEQVKNLRVYAVEEDLEAVARSVDFVFSALDMDKEKIKEIEIAYASREIPVVSNNSAHRWTPDVPMIIPEVNQEHVSLVDTQRQNRGWKRGLIAVKPNCSIQCYVPPLHALWEFGPQNVVVSTYQAISGAGKTFATWPEMVDNVIPFINGEEKKSEDEPLKVWGSITDGKLESAVFPKISATCIRVPVTNGHMASVNASFKMKPAREQVLSAWKNFRNPLEELNLPSAPKEFLRYFEEENRPQTLLDRNLERGMAIALGRLREDTIFDWKFVALSHNTIRGAAGGAILVAELLRAKGYL